MNLIETLIYIALSTMVTTTMVVFSWTTLDAQFQTEKAITIEGVGLYWLRTIAVHIQNKEPIVLPQADDFYQLEDFTFATTTTTIYYSFSIQGHDFNQTLFTK